MADGTLQRAFDQIHRDAERLAGGLTDLSQRATVYHHIFRASGGNHVFPLIAAHGALWAGGYFRFGMNLGRCLSWQYLTDPALRQTQLQRLGDFANAFREINRRVCVDIYTNFHFTAEYGEHPEASSFVPPDLLETLNRVHAAQRAGHELSDAEKRAVFSAHFLQEQQFIVGPRIRAAVAAFEWPVLRELALRPPVRFAYFPRGRWLQFWNFAAVNERIKHGLHAFQWAAEAGWSTVERRLNDYRVLPTEFFADNAGHFDRLRGDVLGWAA